MLVLIFIIFIISGFHQHLMRMTTLWLPLNERGRHQILLSRSCEIVNGIASIQARMRESTQTMIVFYSQTHFCWLQACEREYQCECVLSTPEYNFHNNDVLYNSSLTTTDYNEENIYQCWFWTVLKELYTSIYIGYERTVATISAMQHLMRVDRFIFHLLQREFCKGQASPPLAGAWKPKSFPIFVSFIKQWRVIQCALFVYIYSIECASAWKFVDCKPHIRCCWRFFFVFVLFAELLVRRYVVRVKLYHRNVSTCEILTCKHNPGHLKCSNATNGLKNTYTRNAHTHKHIRQKNGIRIPCSSLAFGFVPTEFKSIVIKALKNFLHWAYTHAHTQKKNAQQKHSKLPYHIGQRIKTSRQKKRRSKYIQFPWRLGQKICEHLMLSIFPFIS